MRLEDLQSTQTITDYITGRLKSCVDKIKIPFVGLVVRPILRDQSPRIAKISLDILSQEARDEGLPVLKGLKLMISHIANEKTIKAVDTLIQCLEDSPLDDTLLSDSAMEGVDSPTVEAILKDHCSENGFVHVKRIQAIEEYRAASPSYDPSRRA